MKNSVIIKSFPNGIILDLSPDISFSDLLSDIAEKFHASSAFFKDAKMALSIKGRTLSDFEQQQVLDAISENSSLQIVCIIEEDEAMNQHFVKALQQTDTSVADSYSSEGQFYRGTLKNGQVLETESSIVILGDVYPGSAIISARDIIVLGGLFGKAYAGGNGNQKHFISALEMSPEKLKIGDFKYNSKDKTAKWSIRSRMQPKIAYIKENKVVIDSITKELLSELPV